jgi:AraC-like DNA-binding protein
MTKINTLPLGKIGSVGTFYVQAELDYLRGIGIDPCQLYDDETIAEVKVIGGRIPIVRAEKMLQQAIAYTGDPDFALRVGASILPKHLGIFGFAAMSGQRLGDVVEMLLHYETLVTDFAVATLVANGDHIELHRHSTLYRVSPILLQQTLACWIVIARQLIARPHEPADAHFNFPAPANIALYREVFGGEVYFDAPVTKLVFHKSLLDQPLIQHDPATHSLLMLQVEKTFQSLIQSTFLQQLREHLSANLASNTDGINEVAAAFRMSARTLQNQLKAEGYSYRALLEKVRQDHAEHFLKNTDRSLLEIAALLGYSEQSPFQNAFKKWTGMSPGEYRRTHGASAQH